MIHTMTDYTSLIQKYLPQHLHEVATQYKIPVKYIQEDAELVVLVLESKSLAQPEEKQNWFDLMEMMNPEQVEKLRDILTREKQKIAEIEAKYEAKKKEIKAKYQTRFDMYTQNARMQKIKATEQSQRAQEMEDADDLLNNL